MIVNKKNAQMFAVATAAAMIVGTAAWFLDDVVAGLRTALPPMGVQGPGVAAARTSFRADPPGLALVPTFNAQPMTNTELFTHYLRQMPLDPSPTLDQWQKVPDDMPKDARGSAPLTLPLGPNH